MKTSQTSLGSNGASSSPADFPDASSLAALRSWFEGMPARECVSRYLGHTKLSGQSSRGILGTVRRRLVAIARQLGRPDLAEVFEHPEADRTVVAAKVSAAIEELRVLRMRRPQLDDSVDRWFSPRIARALHARGIQTLGLLTVRVPRRKMWWIEVVGLGRNGAREVEALFAQHPALTAAAQTLMELPSSGAIVSWEQLSLSADLDGSNGRYRAALDTCTLDAKNDYDAVSAWLSLHEAPATQRAYRKEAERLMLWITLERAKALSSMNMEDATTYRAFLRRPTPHLRWVGPPAPRVSPEWRPFAGALSAQSIAYALSVLGAMFRWLVEQRYVLANPFSGIKVRGASRAAPLDSGRSFSDAEWSLIRTVADGLEWSYGWDEPAAQRLRFLLDFCYATGLRAGELLGASLGSVSQDASGDWWLRIVGKGSKPGKVSVPPLARSALDLYLMQRGLPITPSLWQPGITLVGNLSDDNPKTRISKARLWSIVKRFFQTVADVVQASSPKLADKLADASTHWMRHTHATHALERGAELTTVRDNLRHASLSTTSTYLHGDEIKRARQMRDAFASRV